MKLIYIVLSVFYLIGCNQNENKKNAFPLNNNSNDEFEIYKNLALNNGDTLAYRELSIDYMDSPNRPFLQTALTMANKYEYHLAYADVYYILTDYYHKKEFTELNNLDKKTREMALEYLKVGAEKGNSECKMILGYHMINGTYIKKDSLKGIKLIEEANN